MSDPMPDDELLSIANEFRRELLGWCSSVGNCFVVSAPLAGLLSAYGVAADLIEGRSDYGNHVWLRLSDGRVLDPTADQFNTEGRDPLPPVYLGPPTWIHSDDNRVLT